MVIEEAQFEDFIEQAFWEYDSILKNKEYEFYSERDRFKMACRRARAMKDIVNEDGL